jgi:hypothetical protein
LNTRWTGAKIVEKRQLRQLNRPLRRLVIEAFDKTSAGADPIFPAVAAAVAG